MSLNELRGPWSLAKERRRGRSEITIYLAGLIILTVVVWCLAFFGAAQLFQRFVG